MSRDKNVITIIPDPTYPICEEPQVNSPTPTTVPIVILIDSFSRSTHQLTSFVFLHNVSSFVCLAASIEKEHRRPACAPSQPCLYSAFENSTPLFFFSRICAIRSAICAAASTGGTPCLLDIRYNRILRLKHVRSRMVDNICRHALRCQKTRALPR